MNETINETINENEDVKYLFRKMMSSDTSYKDYVKYGKQLQLLKEALAIIRERKVEENI